jgi:hypothetical protein
MIYPRCGSGDSGADSESTPEKEGGGTGWKVAVVLLSIAVLALGGTTAYFSVEYQDGKTRVEELSTENEKLSREVSALPYVLEGLEAVSRQTVKAIDKYYPGNEQDKGEWQDYVTDSLETIEKLAGIYREYLEGGKLENTSFMETVEKIVNEFLESDKRKTSD